MDRGGEKNRFWNFYVSCLHFVVSRWICTILMIILTNFSCFLFFLTVFSLFFFFEMNVSTNCILWFQDYLYIFQLIINFWPFSFCNFASICTHFCQFFMNNLPSKLYSNTTLGYTWIFKPFHTVFKRLNLAEINNELESLALTVVINRWINKNSLMLLNHLCHVSEKSHSGIKLVVSYYSAVYVHSSLAR